MLGQPINFPSPINGASYRFQIDSDIESDTSVFDVKSPTRENGRRSSTSTNNNNALSGDTTPTPGSPPKAVRSNSESQNTPEKKCVTTMSGNNIAWYYQNLRFEFRSNLKSLWDSAQRFWWGFLWRTLYTERLTELQRNTWDTSVYA